MKSQTPLSCCCLACESFPDGRARLATWEMKDPHAATTYHFCDDCIRRFVDLGLPYRRIGFADWIRDPRRVATTSATFPVDREPATENAASQTFLF